MLRSVVRTIAAGSMAAAMFACGGGGGDGGSTGPTPVFTSVVVTPASPSVSVGLTTTLTAIAKDQSGATFAGASAASWTSSNTAAATVDPASGLVTGVANGSSTITASITAGNVTHTGSQQVSVVTPSSTGNVTATANQVFDPHTVTIARASGTAKVTWTFESLAHTVTWDSQPGSVTDIDLTHDADVSRTFTVPGTYEYHCTIHSNMTGVVIVQ
jgi:plastocyanin